MDLLGVLPAFVVAVVLISASPGPAMALILRRAALHGLRGAVPGARALLEAWRMRGEGAAAAEAEAAPAAAAPPEGLSRRAWWRAFAEGVLVMLANPKAAVFMIAFYPQFIPAGSPLFATTAALGLVQVALETTLYLGLAAAVGRARGWFARPAVRRRLEALSGAVLVALGVRVAASSR